MYEVLTYPLKLPLYNRIYCDIMTTLIDTLLVPVYLVSIYRLQYTVYLVRYLKRLHTCTVLIYDVKD